MLSQSITLTLTDLSVITLPGSPAEMHHVGSITFASLRVLESRETHLVERIHTCT